MPGIVLHGLLAHNLMSDWQRCSQSSLQFDDPRVRNAFAAGAMAPDMGFLPGCEQLISDLAHYVSSGDLLRAFIARADSEIEFAFAWGWASHVVADVVFHPLINRAVGAWLYDDNQRTVSYAESPSMHIRIEAGLDGACLAHCESGHQLHFGPTFDSASIDYVNRAYGDVYGRTVASNLNLWRAHRRSSSLSRTAVGITKIIAAQSRGTRPPLRLWPLNCFYQTFRLATSLSKSESAAHALTHTVRSSSWLLEQVQEAIHRFPSVFFEMVRDGAANLPNYNLDLGAVEDPQQPYVLTTRTLATKSAFAGSTDAYKTP